MKHHFGLVGYGTTPAQALEALTMRLAGRKREPTDGAALAAAGPQVTRRVRDPREIAREAVAFQDALRERGMNVPTWQAVDAVM